MHICQLANFYGPISGGIRTAIDQLSVRYALAGHRCTLIIPDDRTRVVERPHRTEYRIAAPLVPGFGGYRMIADSTRVSALLDELRPDVVELSDKATLLRPAIRSRELGAAVVLISHERLDAVLGQRLRWLPGNHRGVVRFNRFVASHVDAIVAASGFAASEFDGLIDDVRLRRISLGIDLDDFSPGTPSPEAVRRRAERPLIISAVRLSGEKRPDLLVAASRALVADGVDHRWRVYGDGSMRRRLASAADDLPITFHGHCDDRAALATAMADADVAVAPGPHETFGLAALEMLASGTPVVVPRSGALPELVTPGTGTVAALSGESFAAGIRTLLSGNRDRQRERCRARAEQFGWDHTAEDLLAIHVDVVGRRSGRDVAIAPVAGRPADDQAAVARSYL